MKMRTIAAWVLAVGLVLAGGITLHRNQQSDIGIIGGADGPTVIYLSGSPRAMLLGGVSLAAGLVLAGGLYLSIRNAKGRNR